MFENLIESKQKGTRTIGQTVLSVLVHGGLIFGAVKATQGVAETIKNRPIDTTMVFLKPPAAAPAAARPAAARRHRGRRTRRRRGSRRWWRRPTSRRTFRRST